MTQGLCPAPSARLALAIDAAHGAGLVLQDHFGGALSVQTKSNAIDLVTTADRAAEAMILERLAAGQPDYAIEAEESGSRDGKPGAPRWVVDPLDGTTNYAHTYPHYAVSIGLVEDEVPVLGVVHDPSRGETFFAERGQGAWLQTRQTTRRAVSSAATSLGQSILATGFGYDRATAQRNNVAEFGRVVTQVRGMRRAGSAALDLAWVAAGRLDGYWEFGLAPWDWCAGVVLAREAGAVVATVEGAPWTLTGASICVGSAALVRSMLGALKG